jgi:putative hemolysin
MKTAYLLFVALPLLFSGCKPAPGVLPTIEEVSARTSNLTNDEVRKKCYDDGGKYEVWNDEDGSSETFCVFKEGWGCKPEEYAYGSCGKGY